MEPEGPAAVPGSYRDPSGFVFRREGVVYRQLNAGCQAAYDRLMGSGLYAALTETGRLVPHVEVGPGLALTGEAYQVIRPVPVPFTSYPYEWCFSQLKDAALLTLDVQHQALEFGMSLKDASAYNVQFVGGRALLIDTLSFEPHRQGEPWVAYRQFCEHFLAPLALMSRADVRLQHLLRAYVEGIPLDLASRLLPVRSWLRFPLLSHLHLHARAQSRYADRELPGGRRAFGRTAFLGLLDSLRAAVAGLRWRPAGAGWQDYYATSEYSADALEHKRQLVSAFLDRLVPPPRSVWDLGANTGLFSRSASERGILTLALDGDPAAVEVNYRETRARGETSLLPLVIDLTNPTPGLGWENRERESLLERGPAGAVLALALVHHLAIASNLPLGRVARFFAGLSPRLIVEFVPKEDPQVQRLLRYRQDIFPEYDQAHFEGEFGRLFTLEDRQPIRDTGRLLYLMSRRGG